MTHEEKLINTKWYKKGAAGNTLPTATIHHEEGQLPAGRAANDFSKMELEQRLARLPHTRQSHKLRNFTVQKCNMRHRITTNNEDTAPWSPITSSRERAAAAAACSRIH